MAKKSETSTTRKSAAKPAAAKTAKPSTRKAAATGNGATKASNGTKTTKPRAPRTKKAAAPQPVITVTHDQIAARAFLIWEAKGRPHGLDEQNWREAEAQLRNEMAS